MQSLALLFVAFLTVQAFAPEGNFQMPFRPPPIEGWCGRFQDMLFADFEYVHRRVHELRNDPATVTEGNHLDALIRGERPLELHPQQWRNIVMQLDLIDLGFRLERHPNGNWVFRPRIAFLEPPPGYQVATSGPPTLSVHLDTVANPRGTTQRAIVDRISNNLFRTSRGVAVVSVIGEPETGTFWALARPAEVRLENNAPLDLTSPPDWVRWDWQDRDPEVVFVRMTPRELADFLRGVRFTRLPDRAAMDIGTRDVLLLCRDAVANSPTSLAQQLLDELPPRGARGQRSVMSPQGSIGFFGNAPDLHYVLVTGEGSSPELRVLTTRRQR